MNKVIITNAVEFAEQKNFKTTKYNLVASGDEDFIVSDGYHTFTELYDHRITLFVVLAKQILYSPYGKTPKYRVWRSKVHSDGSVMQGWFVMGIGTEKGSQITYHIPMDRWEETGFAEELEKAPEWDGHTSDDVINRLKLL